MKILIASDKFKGSLSSQQVNQALAELLLAQLPTAEVQTLPIADGGEGLLASLQQPLNLELFSLRCADPLGREHLAKWGWQASHQTAWIESAEANGLQWLSPAERNPWLTHTAGVGQLLLAAQQAGAQQIWLGLGSSSTIDGGIGCLGALGFRFLDAHGQLLPALPTSLGQVAEVHAPEQTWPPLRLLADVEHVLCGSQGGVMAFGPQKGGSPTQLQQLEQSLTHWVHVLEAHTGKALHKLKGGGAAGGLGLGLVALLDAELLAGSEWLLQALQLPARLQQVDLLITGEGRFDATSWQGKICGQLIRAAQQAGKPVMVVCGQLAPDTPLRDPAAKSAPAPVILPLADIYQPAREPDAQTTLAQLQALGPHLIKYLNGFRS